MPLGDLARRRRREYGGAGDIAMTPELEASLVSRVGDRALGGIAATANVLDLPGSTVRDLIAGQGIRSFDQWLPGNWTSSANRTTGRQILQQFGLQDRRTGGFGAGLAGVAAEIALDPMTYMTFGGSALTKAGTIAKGTGLLDDVTRVAANRMGMAAGQVGRRESRVSTTLKELLDVAPAEKVQQARDFAGRMGVNLDDVVDQKLGGLVGFKLPFTGNIGVAGAGSTGQRLARKMDSAEAAVRYARVPGTSWQPVNAATRLFDATIGEAKTAVGQAAARRLFDTKTKNQWAVRKKIGGLLTELEDAGVATEDYADAIRYAFEVPGATDKIAPQLRGAVDAVKKDLRYMPNEAADFGIPLKDYIDPAANYFPRYLTQGRHPVGKGSNQVFSTFDPSQVARLEFLHGIEGATVTSKNVFKDDVLNALADSKAPVKDVADRLRTLYGGKASDQYVSPLAIKEMKNLVRGVVKDKQLRTNIIDAMNQSTAEQSLRLLQQYLPSAATQLDAIAKKHTKDRFAEMGKWYRELSSETRSSGVFGNHPIADLQARMMSFSDAVDGARTFLETLAQPSVLKNATTAPTGMTVEAALRKAGMKIGTPKQGAIRKLGDMLGIDPNTMTPEKYVEALSDLRQARIDPGLAEDLIRMQKGFSQPDSVSPLLETIQTITNFYKTNLTSPFPAFHTRNLFSGQFQNWIRRIWSSQSVNDANAMLNGGVVKGASEIPAIKAIWDQRQLTRQRAATLPPAQFSPSFAAQAPAGFSDLARPGTYAAKLDDAEATRILSELAYGYQIVGRHQGEATNVVGQATQMVPGSVEDMLRQSPSPKRDGFSFADATATYLGMTKDTTFNPMHARGVAGQVDSRFAPLAGGEKFGYYVEGLNRLSPFIHQLRKGIDPAEAAKRIGETQVNYANRHYTKFERDRMAMLFPFYKFSRGMLPHTMKTLIEEPGGRLAQTIRTANSMRETDALTPDYISETASIPLNGAPVIGDAPAGTQRYLAGLGLMFEDPLSFVGGGARGALLEAGSRMNPLAKAPLEWMTGESFFQKGPRGGRDLEDLDPSVGRLLSNVGQVASDPSSLISGKTTERVDPVRWPGSDWMEFLIGNSPAARVLTTARTATDPRKGISAKALNLLTGLRISDVSPEASEAIVRERTRDIMKDLGSKTFERTYFPQENIDRLTPAQQLEVLQLQALMNTLAARAKERAAASK